MTNFEWLLLPKNRPLLREMIISDVAMQNGKICSCGNLGSCDVCDFGSINCIDARKREILDEPYEQHYGFEIGEAVVVSFPDGQQIIGLFNGEKGDRVYVTTYLTNVGQVNTNGDPRGDGYRKSAIEITAYERN
jgi:hypothetical protein